METRVFSLPTPPEVLQLRVGDTCRVNVDYGYSGPQVPAKIRVAIGRVGVFGFDEIVYNVVSITVPDTPQKKTYRTPVDIYISPAMTVQPGYDIYAKIVDIPGADIYSATYHNVIEIVEEAGYTLEVTVEPIATGSVTKSPIKAAYTAGEVVNLSAVPYSGYEFDHWGGWPLYPGVGSTSPSIQIEMTSDWWIVAVFKVEYVPPPVIYTCSTCGATYNSQAELDAHIAAVHTSTEMNWYRVTFYDGSVRDVAVPYIPGSNISLWDIVDRNQVASFVYLGFY